MYVQKNRPALTQRILAVIAKQPGLMAWEIARVITTQTNRPFVKHDVNSVLYSELRLKVSQNEEFAWYLEADFIALGQSARREAPALPVQPPSVAKAAQPRVIQAPQPIVIQAPPTRVVHEHVAKDVTVRVQAPRFFYAVAALLLVVLIVTLNGQAKQVPDNYLRTNSYGEIPTQDLIIVRDTILVEVKPTIEELTRAGRLDALYREILDLERDTLEIGLSIADMQRAFDPREFVGNRAELAYAQGRYQRVCKALYEKQDSLAIAMR